jgi:hypothetical protein
MINTKRVLDKCLGKNKKKNYVYSDEMGEINAAQSSGFHYPEGICNKCAMDRKHCKCAKK